MSMTPTERIARAEARIAAVKARLSTQAEHEAERLERLADRLETLAAQDERRNARKGQIARAAELYAEGKSVADIGVALGVGLPTVYNRLRAAGVQLRGVARQQMRRAEIAEQRRSGMTLQEIARQHGVTHERIRQILVAIGDPALIGRKKVAPQSLPPCARCGAPVKQLHNKYCSLACKGMASRGPRRADWREYCERIAALRAQGLTWKVVSELVGSTNAQRDLERALVLTARAGPADQKAGPSVTPLNH